MNPVNAMKRILFGSDIGHAPDSRTYAWNLASSIAYSAQSALLLLVVSRFGGLEAAGRFSIYYITTTMLASVGSYSMRNYQVSDAKQVYSFGTYLGSRFATSVLMMVMCLGYAAIWQPNPEGIAVVLLLGVYRATDAIEDVYHGEVQRLGRLDAASIAHAVRIVLSFVAFTVAYVVTVDLAVAAGALALSSIVLFVLTMPAFLDVYPKLAVRPLMYHVGKLLAVCLPICAAAVLYNFIANLPRYAIEAAMSAEMQGIFNILFMPVFVVDMLSTVIFNPVVADMGRYWQDGDLPVLRKIVLRQVGVIAVLSVGCAVVGYLIGCPVLGFIYGADLGEWSGLLALLLLLGGISALASFAVVLLTVMRRQGFILAGYIVAIGSSVLYLNPLVTNYGLVGAGCSYGILMSVALLVFAVVAVVAAARKGKGGESRA